MASFNEGVAHTFDYAVVLHGPNAAAALAREGQAFLRPPMLLLATPPRVCHGWGLSSQQLVISALRPCGEGVFVRLYEASGVPAAGRLRLPAGITAWAPADGLERPLAAFAPCRGEVDVTLRPFGIKAYVFR